MTKLTPIDTIHAKANVLDIIGVGFGPSNIAVSIAQKELAPHLNTLFLEKRPSFGWHDTMLFSDATMQVNFLKDLVSFRNPRSAFSFVSFLHDHDRLADFTNLQTLFPRRVEFHQYLSWCAEQLDDDVIYGTSVNDIERVTLHGEDLYRVRYSTATGTSERYARSIVHSGGLEPNIPFQTTETARVSHGYHILNSVKDHAAGAHYAVVGGGQSAAEIVQYLYNSGAKVSAIVPRFGYMPADDSPFVNQIFDPDQIDPLFNAPAQTRARIHDMHASTNYAGVDIDLLKDLYADWYQDKITGQNRIQFNRMCRVTSATETSDGVTLSLVDKLDPSHTEMSVDYLVCATGFNARSVLDLMSETLKTEVIVDASGDPVFERDYSLSLSSDAPSTVYAPHMSEKQHGLTATLLSNMALRSGEIIESIVEKLGHSAVPQDTREVVNA